MNKIRDFISRLMQVEPTLVISTASGILLILANFGVAPAIDVDAAVMTAFNGLAVLATVLGIRQGVFSPKTTQDIANGATNLPAGTPVDIGAPPSGDVTG